MEAGCTGEFHRRCRYIATLPGGCRDLSTRSPTRLGVGASRVQLAAGSWNTVLEGLVARFPAIDRERWLDRMARGLVIDARGVRIDAETPYRAGVVIRYWREVPDEPRIDAAESVLCADEHLVVADKPHGLPVMPAGDAVAETLLARLVRRNPGANGATVRTAAQAGNGLPDGEHGHARDDAGNDGEPDAVVARHGSRRRERRRRVPLVGTSPGRGARSWRSAARKCRPFRSPSATGAGWSGECRCCIVTAAT